MLPNINASAGDSGHAIIKHRNHLELNPVHIQPQQQLAVLIQAKNLKLVELKKTTIAFEQWKEAQEKINQQLIQENALLEKEILKLQQEIEAEHNSHANKMQPLQKEINQLNTVNQQLVKINKEWEIYRFIKEESKLLINRGDRYVMMCLSSHIVNILENNQLKNEEKIQAVKDLKKSDFNTLPCSIL